TRNSTLADGLTQTRLHGMSAGAADRTRGNLYRHWDMERMGVKANLPDILAALLPSQIATIRDRLPIRHRLAERYREALAGHEGITLPAPIANAVDAHHLFAIGVEAERRDYVLRRLGEAGVGVAVNYRAVPSMRFYRDTYNLPRERYAVSHRWGESCLSLPLFPGLTDDEQEFVIEQLSGALVRSAA
ncbi:MAG: DegT/DnrJ/EryC1/StrS family aminotransferase, partial [Myxococcota bacterium]